MNKMNNQKEKGLLNARDRLLLHQLRLLEWQDARNNREEKHTIDELGNKGTTVPEIWNLTKGINLYAWQEECIVNWFNNSCRGTVKVVTGGGKTILALAIAERLQNTKAPDLRVAIIVPTIVLMNQWYDVLIERGNIPANHIGKLGSGFKDDFSDNRRILICVLASAYKELPGFVKKSGIGSKLLN